MKTIAIIGLGIITIIGVGSLFNGKFQKTIPVPTADEYCQSQGYDIALKRDGVGKDRRVMCFKDRYEDKGFMWYQYPPKTDLEKYCQGNL